MNPSPPLAVVISCSATICSLGYKRAAIKLVSLSPPLSLCIGGVDEFQQFNGGGMHVCILKVLIQLSKSMMRRVKFWNVAYLEEMDYDKTKKPLILPKSQIRSKSKKLAAAREVEHQLPSSGRSNKAEFFQGLKPE